MSTWRKICSLSLGFSVISSLSSLSFAGMARYKYEWPVVQRSNFYIITVSENMRDYPIFTRYTELYLENEEILVVSAFDEQKKFISSPLVTKIDLAARSIPPSPIPPPPKKRVFTPEELERLAHLKELEEEENIAFKGDPFRYLSLYAGYGKESLDIKGGTATFKGTTPELLGGGKLIILSGDKKKPSALSYMLRVFLHDFKTSEKITESNGDETLKETKYSRATWDILTRFSLYKATKLSLYGNLGPSILQVVVADNNLSDDVTDFKSTRVYGLKLGLDASYLFTDALMGSMDLATTPFALSSSTKSVYAFSLNLGGKFYFIPKQAYAEFLYIMQREGAQNRLQCNSDKNCDTSGTSQSSLKGVLLGLGLYF